MVDLFRDKSVLVTGSADGLRRALALGVAHGGGKLVLAEALRGLRG